MRNTGSERCLRLLSIFKFLGLYLCLYLYLYLFFGFFFVYFVLLHLSLVCILIFCIGSIMVHGLIFNER